MPIFSLLLTLIHSLPTHASAPPRCEVSWPQYATVLAAGDERECFQECARHAHDSGMRDFSCRFGAKTLPIQGFALCHLVNELEEAVDLEEGPCRSGRRREVFLTEKECQETCRKFSEPRDREACYWGEKEIFKNFPAELKRCERKVDDQRFVLAGDVNTRRPLMSYEACRRIMSAEWRTSPGTFRWGAKEEVAPVTPEFECGKDPIALALWTPAKGSATPVFWFGKQSWQTSVWSADEPGGEEPECAPGKRKFQLTWNGRKRGEISPEKFTEALLGPRAKPARMQFAPAGLHDKMLVLTNLQGEFRDPLGLRLEKADGLDLAPYQAAVLQSGRVRTYAKGRYLRAHPPAGKQWLRPVKVYRGEGGVRLFHFEVRKAEAGIVDDPAYVAKMNRRPETLTLFVLEREGKRTVLDLPPGTWLIDSGDYNGDGQSELLFAGDDSERPAYLMDAHGQFLVGGGYGGSRSHMCLRGVPTERPPSSP